MSIRTDNEGLAGAASSGTGRTGRLLHSTGAGKSTAAPGASSEDRVQLSSLAEAISAEQSQRAATVQRLAAMVRSGSYQVDSVRLARALVNDALEAGGTEMGTESGR